MAPTLRISIPFCLPCRTSSNSCITAMDGTTYFLHYVSWISENSDQNLRYIGWKPSQCIVSIHPHCIEQHRLNKVYQNRILSLWNLIEIRVNVFKCNKYWINQNFSGYSYLRTLGSEELSHESWLFEKLQFIWLYSQLKCLNIDRFYLSAENHLLRWLDLNLIASVLHKYPVVIPLSQVDVNVPKFQT